MSGEEDDENLRLLIDESPLEMKKSATEKINLYQT
jgi:hypothetical protein